MKNNNKYFLLSFDVEDWFQVENFKPYISRDTWNIRELRVKESTLKILDILDSFDFKPRATFFILGWVAEKIPELVFEIHKRGHETASHGLDHRLCTKLDETTLLSDLVESKKLLESIINSKVYGFRAPSFALKNNSLNIIKKAGYIYDSSLNTFSMNKRYKKPGLKGFIKKDGIYKNNNFYELPLSNLEKSGSVFPVAGGGYFRLFPLRVFNYGIKQILKKNNAFVFYAHPWEFDPDQPRVKEASKNFKFRHYVNISKTEKKFTSLIKSFQDMNFISLKSYLDTINN